MGEGGAGRTTNTVRLQRIVIRQLWMLEVRSGAWTMPMRFMPPAAPGRRAVKAMISSKIGTENPYSSAALAASVA